MKFVIKRKEKLTSNIFLMEVTAEWVARSAKPGQFVIVIIDDKGERIPLTICDYDPVKGTIVLVFQVVGKSTEKMASLAVGEKFKDIVGPLGKESLMMNLPDEELKNRRMLFVAGGVGTAPIYPQLKWAKKHGMHADDPEVGGSSPPPATKRE